MKNILFLHNYTLLIRGILDNNTEEMRVWEMKRIHGFVLSCIPLIIYKVGKLGIEPRRSITQIKRPTIRLLSGLSYLLSYLFPLHLKKTDKIIS